MKHLLLVVMFFLLPLSAFSQENLTSKPVGFVRVELPAGVQTLVSTPFVPFDDSINAVLSGQLTGSTNESLADKVFKWDTARAQYVAAVKADGTGAPGVDGNWFSDLVSLTPSDMTINPGEGFFILNNSGTNETVILSGGMALVGTNQTALAPSMNLIGYPFSTAIAFDETGLWNLMQASGDEITDVSTNTQGMMLPGNGYWYNRKGGSAVWTEVRPYADIFPSDGNPPQITGMGVAPGGGSVKLQLSRTGILNVDVFYKEMSGTGALDTATGWSVAETNIPAAQVEWADCGSNGRSPVSGAYGRYYLVGNADIDSNGNGIPDDREMFCPSPSSSLSGTGMSSPSAAAAAAANRTAGSGAGSNTLFRPVFGNAASSGIIYVDQQNGNDALSGCAMMAMAGGGAGPKKTIGAGLAAAESGDTLVIESGRYGENLNIAGRDISAVIAGKVDISGHSAALSVSLPLSALNVVGVSTNSVRK